MNAQEVITIDPVPKTQMITKIQLSVPQFVLNATEMDVSVALFTNQMKIVDSITVHIPPDIYKDWGVDDNHIINYVITQLNVHKTA